MGATKTSSADAGPRLKQDNKALYDALDRLVRVYQFRDRQRACYEDLSVNECYALQAILDHDGMAQNDLAAELWLDKSTTSRLVARMEENGYARRIPDADDGRIQRLCATESGKRLNSRIRRNLLRRQLRAISDLPEDARRAAIIVLQRLSDVAVQSVDGRAHRS